MWFIPNIYNIVQKNLLCKLISVNIFNNMNLKIRSIFAVLSFSILALIMTAYSNTIQPTYIATYAQENEAEVEADI